MDVMARIEGSGVTSPTPTVPERAAIKTLGGIATEVPVEDRRADSREHPETRVRNRAARRLRHKAQDRQRPRSPCVNAWRDLRLGHQATASRSAAGAASARRAMRRALPHHASWSSMVAAAWLQPSGS